MTWAFDPLPPPPLKQIRRFGDQDLLLLLLLSLVLLLARTLSSGIWRQPNIRTSSEICPHPFKCTMQSQSQSQFNFLFWELLNCTHTKCSSHEEFYSTHLLLSSATKCIKIHIFQFRCLTSNTHHWRGGPLLYHSGQGRPEQVRNTSSCILPAWMSKQRAFSASSEIFNFENRSRAKNVSEGDISSYPCWICAPQSLDELRVCLQWISVTIL